MDACELVLIEWLDSRQPIASWQHLRDLAIPEVCRCVSVGFLIHDDGNKKVVAPNLADLSDDDMQASGMIVIPTPAVLRVVKLHEED